jgi:hypothetical protein
MKLTNEQKGKNSALTTGIKVLGCKIERLQGKVAGANEVILLNQKCKDRTVPAARITVAEWDIRMCEAMIGQLQECIEILEINKH